MSTLYLQCKTFKLNDIFHTVFICFKFGHNVLIMLYSQTWISDSSKVSDITIMNVFFFLIQFLAYRSTGVAFLTYKRFIKKKQKKVP